MRRHSPLLLILLVGVTQTACQTGLFTSKALPTLEEQAAAESTQKELEAAAPSNKTENLKPVPLSFNSHKHMFCEDTIYAKHLQEKYISDSMPGIHAIKNRRLRRRARRNLKYHVSHFVNERIDGPHAPYFGGLPVVETPTVEIWLKYFQNKGRSTFLKWLVRSKSYENVLVPLLQKEGLPKELFFLAMIESGFSNTAYSRARATGTWQFMSRTAKHYGLRIDYWVDERRDPIKSTLAAGRFLKDLYSRFGDWYLAIAAYNAGPGKVQRAIRKTKSRDFWKLARSPYLRRETKNYVPKMLAALIIASDPQKYGFQIIPDPRDHTPITTVALTEPRSLQDISQKLGISKTLLKRWNPEIIRGVTPPLTRSRPSYPLRLPAIISEDFKAIIASLPKLEIQNMKTYRVRRGDTISTIARRHRVSTRKIMDLNPNLKPRRLKPGRKIVIPIPAIIKKQPKETA